MTYESRWSEEGEHLGIRWVKAYSWRDSEDIAGLPSSFLPRRFLALGPGFLPCRLAFVRLPVKAMQAVSGQGVRGRLEETSSNNNQSLPGEACQSECW